MKIDGLESPTTITLKRIGLMTTAIKRIWVKIWSPYRPSRDRSVLYGVFIVSCSSISKLKALFSSFPTLKSQTEMIPNLYAH